MNEFQKERNKQIKINWRRNERHERNNEKKKKKEREKERQKKKLKKKACSRRKRIYSGKNENL